MRCIWRCFPSSTNLPPDTDRGVAISDLRWGIDTGRMSEEESSRKVLSVCFEQINECKPYMVVLLGERYGFIPYTKDDDDGGPDDHGRRGRGRHERD